MSLGREMWGWKVFKRFPFFNVRVCGEVVGNTFSFYEKCIRVKHTEMLGWWLAGTIYVNLDVPSVGPRSHGWIAVPVLMCQVRPDSVQQRVCRRAQNRQIMNSQNISCQSRPLLRVQHYPTFVFAHIIDLSMCYTFVHHWHWTIPVPASGEYCAKALTLYTLTTVH